jgi:uncharacterized protein (TIGR02246 family)
MVERISVDGARRVCRSCRRPGHAGVGARVTAGGWLLVGVALAGCSSAERTPPPRVGASGPVPVIVSRPRPFSISTLAARRTGQAVPARLAGLEPGDRPAVTETAGGDAAQVNWQMAAAAPVAAEQGIREALRAYGAAFNRHDAAALAAHWTDEGTSLDLASGDVTAGRAAVQDVFSALFAQDDAAAIQLEVEAIRPVRADVAVVDGVSRLSFAEGASTGNRFSAVMVRGDDGRWRLESMREASAAPATAPAAAAHPLDDLVWLLGAWEDIGEGVTAGTRCFWSAGRGFLVRTHAVTLDDVPQARPAPGDERIPGLLPAGPPRALELTEIIGWDPHEEVIRSWVFTSTGGFAEGRWTRDGAAWKVRLEGRGRDTGRSCVCTLLPQGIDGVSMTCDSDALAHLLPPACDFVRTARAD